MTILTGTGQALKTLVLSRAGDHSVSPDFADELETYIQAAYLSVLGAYPWTFARKNPPGVLTTVAEITTGSVTLTNGSTAGTFSSAPAVSVSNRKIVGDADAIVYRISSHVAGSASFTLDAAYAGDGGSGLSYTVFQDEYSLATDFLAPVNTTRFLRDCHGTYDIDLVHPNRLDAMYPYAGSTAGSARYCAFIRHQTMRIAPYPTEAHRYEYEYIYDPGSLTFDGGVSDTLIIEPSEDSLVVAYTAAAELMMDMNDDRWSALAEAGPEKLAHMKRAQRRMLKQGMFVRPQFNVGTPR